MTEREQQLVAALQSAVVVEREEAARAIRDERLGAEVAEALRLAVLSDPSPTVRYYAVQAGLEVDVLVTVLAQESMQSVRREAAGSLFAHAADSMVAQRALVAALHDDDYEVRAKAFSWLGDDIKLIRRANLIPVLISLLEDRDPAIRVHAAEILGRAKYLAVDALPHLRAALEAGHVESDLRAEVTRAILRIEASAKKLAR